MGKIRVIIKRPDEKYGHCTNISPRLENLQNIVGGYIEIVHLTDKIVLIVNEDGRRLELARNFRIFSTAIVGTAIVAGMENNELTDCPVTFKSWKGLLDVHED